MVRVPPNDAALPSTCGGGGRPNPWVGVEQRPVCGGDRVDRWRRQVFDDIRRLWSSMWTEATAGLAAQPGGERLHLPACQLNWLLEWGFADKLRRLVLAVSQRPHSSLRDRRVVVPTGLVKVPALDALLEYGLARLGRLGAVPSFVPQVTTDTPENRFVAAFLDQVLDALVRLERRVSTWLDEREGTPAGEDYGSLEDKGDLQQGLRTALEDTLHRLLRSRATFTALRHLSFLEGIPKTASGPIPSIGVLTDPRYAAVHLLWQTFDRELLPDLGRELNLALLLDWRIYELWCLFRARDTLCSILGPDDPYVEPKRYGAHSWFPREEEPLQHGDRLDLHRVFVWRKSDTVLHFQMPIGSRGNRAGLFSMGLPVRPDMVLQCGDRLAVLDAKHKAPLESTREGRTGLVAEDWLRMHQYRDTIRWHDRPDLGPVRVGVVIFSSHDPCGSTKDGARLAVKRLMTSEHLARHGFGGVYLTDLDNQEEMKHLRELLEGQLDERAGDN